MKTLDSGAQGVMIPHVKTREEAEFAIRCTKYRDTNFPEGIRGATNGVRAAKYHEWDGYWQSANRNTIVIAIIEDKEGVENIDKIASLNQLDAILPGPFDLSISLGHSGQYEHQEVQDKIETVVSACKKYSKPVAGVAWDMDSAKKLVANGVTTLVFDEDVAIMYNAFRNIVLRVDKELRHLAK